MAIRDTSVLRTTDTVGLLNAIRHDASLDYQKRIPIATSGAIQETVRTLQSYRPSWNEFVDALINRIGLTVVRSKSWSNPLAEFKMGLLEFGDSIEEVQVGLLRAHTYDTDRDYMEKTLFGTELPEVQSNFHRVNRRNFYKVSVDEMRLRNAFLTSGGVTNFVTSLMDAPYTSDAYDEFLLTTSLFAEYESNGGFYHVRVPEVSAMESNADDARTALRKIRALGDNLRFLSTRYNAAKMPVAAEPEDLILFTTPEFNAAIDVNALAAAFNIDRASLRGRVIPIPRERFGIEGCEAILTTRDFFVIADQRFDMTEQYNAVPGMRNYFLHRWQVVSASRFVPAVMFNTRSEDEVITVSQNITGVTSIDILAIGDGTVPTDIRRGDMIPLRAVVAGTTTPVGGKLADQVAWSVAGGASSRTYITSTGVLHAGGDETATSLTVTARTAYLDPTNVRKDGVTKTLSVGVTGNLIPLWPETGAIASIEIAGFKVPNVAPGTTTYALTVPKDTVVKVADVEVGTLDSATVNTTVTKVAGGYTVVIKVDPSRPGAELTYTVNVTVSAT